MLSKIGELPILIVALSGGIDSAYLAWARSGSGGPGFVGYGHFGQLFGFRSGAGGEFFRATGAQHEFVETRELENPRIAPMTEPVLLLQGRTVYRARWDCTERQFAAVAYGVNADDTSDFRPGQRAATEHRVLTPLLDAKLHKAEIRFLAQRAELPMWDRPASACLASRLPYGTEVTEERLSLVERAKRS